MRHAEAAPKLSRQDDRSRELTQLGVKHALHMGAWFLENNINLELIACSSALRAEQTAHLIAEGMKLDNQRILVEDVLYEASVRQLLDYVNNLEDGYQNVMIVAHNPAISYLAEYLTKADIGDMTPGAATIIRFDLGSWKLVSENTGILDRYVAPEEVAKY